MSEAILVFQSQLSGVMETVFKAAMYEIVRLVEDSFLEEVSRSRQQVESLKKRLQWSEGRRKEREADGRSRCVDCGRAGVCSEDRSIETEPGSEEGHGLKQENVLEGNWSSCPRDTMDPVPCAETEELAAVSPTKAPESIDLEGDKLDVLKEETLQMTHGGNKPLGRWTMCPEAEDVDDPISEENFSEQKLQQCEAEWGSSTRRSLQAVVGGVVEELAEQFKPSYVAEELSGLEEALNTEPKATYNSQILDAGGLSSQHLEDSLQLNYGGPGLMSAELDVLHVADRSAHPLSQRLRRTGFSERLGGSCSGSPCGDVDVRELNYLLINEDGYLQDSDGRYWGQGGAESGGGEAPGGKRFHSEDPGQAQKTPEDHSVSMSGTQGGGGGGGGRRYSCTQCQISLPDLGSLKVHMRTHKVGPAYTCTQCGKSFTQACNLKVHQRVHSGEGLHLCSHCGKGFISFTDLKRHKCSHTGDKPYCCTLCGNKFSRLWNLKLHRRIHTQEKPHQCTQCDKSFSRADILKVHQRTHTGERPYCCTVCGLSFKRLDHLKSHQRKHRPQ